MRGYYEIGNPTVGKDFLLFDRKFYWRIRNPLFLPCPLYFLQVLNFFF
jgi:hypothetical protein